MRKLLVLLSVVLLFAICQSQKVKDKKDLPKIKRDCFFGYKKVNGTKVCKTKEEFLRHPRNETNCTANKTLKCLKVGDITACRCIKIHRPRPHVPRNFTCPVGKVKRCKTDRFTGKQNCRCVKLGPVLINDTNKDIVCKEGEKKVCKKNGVCLCKKARKERPPVDPNAVGLF